MAAAGYVLFEILNVGKRAGSIARQMRLPILDLHYVPGGTLPRNSGRRVPLCKASTAHLPYVFVPAPSLALGLDLLLDGTRIFTGAGMYHCAGQY
jgi:hypothetical protein